MSKVSDYVEAAAEKKPADFMLDTGMVAQVLPSGALLLTMSEIPSEYVMKLVDWMIENYK